MRVVRCSGWWCVREEGSNRSIRAIYRRGTHPLLVARFSGTSLCLRALTEIKISLLKFKADHAVLRTGQPGEGAMTPYRAKARPLSIDVAVLVHLGVSPRAGLVQCKDWGPLQARGYGFAARLLVLSHRTCESQS